MDRDSELGESHIKSAPILRAGVQPVVGRRSRNVRWPELARVAIGTPPARSRQHGNQYVAVFGNRRFRLTALAIALTFASLFLYVASVPAFIGRELGLPPTEYAVMFVPIVSGCRNTVIKLSPITDAKLLTEPLQMASAAEWPNDTALI
jgi:hypothetical protein